MMKIYDIEDARFLEDHSNNFMNHHNLQSEEIIKKGYSVPAYKICNTSFIDDFLSHYDHIYPEWHRKIDAAYTIQFQPSDKPGISPHTDTHPETTKKIKSYAKRLLIYANPIWKRSWNGGTYFAPFEKYGVNHRFSAKCSYKQFMNEATLVENVPGRAVVFDCDELHMPQPFSGNESQRIIFGCMLIHPERADLISKLLGPDNSGNPVYQLLEP